MELSYVTPLEALWVVIGMLGVVAYLWLTTDTGRTVIDAYKHHEPQPVVKQAWDELLMEVAGLVLVVVVTQIGVIAAYLPPRRDMDQRFLTQINGVTASFAILVFVAHGIYHFRTRSGQIRRIRERRKSSNKGGRRTS